MCGGAFGEKIKCMGGGALAQKIKCGGGGVQGKKKNVWAGVRGKNKMYGGVSAKK